MGDAKKLLSGSSIIFAGTIAASFFAYIFNMLVGRWLGPSQYGEFSALMSLLMILSVGGGTLLTIVMRYSGELYATKNINALAKLIKYFTKIGLVVGIAFFLAGLIFINPLAEFFSIEHKVPVAIALSSFVFGFLIVINKGALQGTQRFMAMSIISTLEAVLKLVLGVLLIKIGLDLSGAIGAAVIATAIVYFATFIPLKKVLREKKETANNQSFKFNKKEMIDYSWPTFFATLLLMVALNIDVILIKHYFDPESAGVYAAISTVAKIVLYATGPIASVMFPIISEHRAKGEKHYRIFMYSLILTLMGGVIILGIYYVAPGKVISMLYGSQYTSFYYLLPQIGFAILLYALVNIIANYFLSIKNFVFLPIFGLVFAGQIIGIISWHSSIEVVIKILISTLGLLFALLFGYYLFTKKEQLTTYLRSENGE